MFPGSERRWAMGEHERVTFADVVAASGPEREESLRALVGSMSLKEKINEMAGNSSWPKLAVMAVRYGIWTFDAGGAKRPGIPKLRFTDGPRGVCLDHSTCFPVAMARGATWDPDLQEKVASAIAREARAQGANFYGGICINVLRHPGWGRAQETFGEDPFHLGEMGVASVRGAQQHLMACAKHFACNSIEESRFYVDVRVDERTLREVYLPHFRKCVEAGVASVMSAYNRVNGEYCGQNHRLLTEILKEEWGFDGPVMSDFVWGVRDGVAAANAGMDIEMPKRWRFGRGFRRAAARGRVPGGRIDDAVIRVVRQKARFANVGEAGGYEKDLVASREHASLALEVARKSMVLLKNDGGALPFERKALWKLAVVGDIAAKANIGDRGSSRVDPPYVTTAIQGIRDRAGGVEVVYDNGSDPRFTRRALTGVDAAVVCVGLTYKEEGEFLGRMYSAGGDRECLALPAAQVELIKLAAGLVPRCAVVIQAGSAVTVQEWKEMVPAILMAWYPGMEGGRAIAEVLFGDVNPGGKLPITFPRSEGQLPPFDKRAKSADYGYYHGYRLFDKEEMDPEFAFGFGLSYTTFSFSNLRLSPDAAAPDGRVSAAVDVTNTGGRAGDETVQLYVGCPSSGLERPVRELKGFRRVSLMPGESRTVSLEIPVSELACYYPETGEWAVEEAEYEVRVGPSSRKSDLGLAATFTVRGHSQ